MSTLTWNDVTNWLDWALKESVILANRCYSKLDSWFDYLSDTAFLEKPTYKLVADELDIPIVDRHGLDSIIQFINEFLSFMISPIKSINDKKFICETFQTPNTFNKENKTPFYDKLIMYIAKHPGSVAEPSNKQIKQMISIDNNDYNVPVRLWYTFILNKSKKIYIYIHIATNGYKGVLVAIHRQDDGLIEELIKAVNDEYNKNPGKSDESDETIEDLLNKNK